MPITAEGPAPYAPILPIMSGIERVRDRGLPSPITRETLGRIGIPDSLHSRTIQSLVLLELIDEEGNHTPNLVMVRKAPEPEYKARFAEIIRSVYADVFAFVDPAVDGPDRVRDAFREYEPHGQQARMVILFLGLCEHAGIIGKRPNVVKADSPTKSERPKRPATPRGRKPNKPPNTDGLPAPIAALLKSLPDDVSGWTQARRDKFHTTFGAVLDFCFPIRESESTEAEKQE